MQAALKYYILSWPWTQDASYFLTHSSYSFNKHRDSFEWVIQREPLWVSLVCTVILLHNYCWLLKSFMRYCVDFGGSFFGGVKVIWLTFVFDADKLHGLATWLHFSTVTAANLFLFLLSRHPLPSCPTPQPCCVILWSLSSVSIKSVCTQAI